MAELSPMMKQYKQIKSQHEDALLFFRLGDFYEMFYKDAEVASKELDLVLTGRDCGQKERAPMCGVPFHSCESYIAKLVANGHKVAICEQVEDPATAQGIVKREVIRIITPGTVIENSILEEGKNNFLLSVATFENTVGIAFADISTGEVKATEFFTSDISGSVISEMSRIEPKEVLLDHRARFMAEMISFAKDKLNAAVEIINGIPNGGIIKKHYNVESLEAIDMQDKPVACDALANLLDYLYSTQMTGLGRLDPVALYNNEKYLKLDISTRRNLEICETMRLRERKGSLLGVLDKTKTAMGKRLMRSFLEQPLVDTVAIDKRQNSVEEFFNNSMLRDEIRNLFDGILDVERLMTKIVYGSANARDLNAVKDIAERVPKIKAYLKEMKSELIKQCVRDMDDLTDVATLIVSAIKDDPVAVVREGKMIRSGYNEELDELIDIAKGGRDVIAKMETEEREKTGVPKLKIGYNRVFGYYIEVSRLNSDKVPENYIRKQTLANAERYITEELKVWESKVLGAQERIQSLEFEIFTKVRLYAAECLPRIQKTASAIALVDVLTSLAFVAAKNGYVRPYVNNSGKLNIKDGRHPVIEDLRSGDIFVPNDTVMDSDTNRTMVITGPNMAGKSTYMRQVAIIVLMAQVGSFVPASSAEISVVDGIFTRVGASDDLASGDSTFMVEMKEVAYILNNATKDSLVIFDEIGRGTSTFDGMSIARAVIEYVTDKIKAKALFATHYHELTEMEEQITGIKNYNVSVKKKGKEVIFLRKIVRGGTDQSLGIEVARLAGIPKAVVTRADDILSQLEETKVATVTVSERMKKKEKTEEISLEEQVLQTEILQKLREIEADTLSPIEALNILYTLCKSVK